VTMASEMVTNQTEIAAPTVIPAASDNNAAMAKTARATNVMLGAAVLPPQPAMMGAEMGMKLTLTAVVGAPPALSISAAMTPKIVPREVVPMGAAKRQPVTMASVTAKRQTLTAAVTALPVPSALAVSKVKIAAQRSVLWEPMDFAARKDAAMTAFKTAMKRVSIAVAYAIRVPPAVIAWRMGIV